MELKCQILLIACEAGVYFVHAEHAEHAELCHSINSISIRDLRHDAFINGS